MKILFAAGLIVISTLFSGCETGPAKAAPPLSYVRFRLLNLDEIIAMPYWGKQREYYVNIVNLGTGRSQKFHVGKDNSVNAGLPPGRYLVSSVNNDYDNTGLVLATGGGFAHSEQKKLPLRLLFAISEPEKSYYFGDVILHSKGAPTITNVPAGNDQNFKIEEE